MNDERTKLSNEMISIEVFNIGAELIELKNNATNLNYLWNGNKLFWGSSSPLLFPIVGSINDTTLRFKGKLYKLGNHGFARKSYFKLISKTKKSLKYLLTSNEETLRQYPYHFELYLIYTIHENEVNIKYIVKNIDKKKMYFQIGAHPGFNCPINCQLSFSDYYLTFNKEETSKRLFFNTENKIISDKEDIGLNNSKILPLKHNDFYEGAQIYKDIKSNILTLQSDLDEAYVKLTSYNLPNLILWQTKDAPFICIEPVNGMADTDEYTGSFIKKRPMISLLPDEEYLASLKIEIG